jgi:hypothetical protein
MEPTEADLGMIVNNPDRLTELRRRLSNPWWMMRFLNEKIARAANAEDKVSGRFWQGRFRMQRLLDASAVAACMVYVDLNPIRAGVAPTPETSQFTSIYDRIQTTIEACRETPPEGWCPNAPSAHSVDVPDHAPPYCTPAPSETTPSDCTNTPTATVVMRIAESKTDESANGFNSCSAKVGKTAGRPRAAWLSPIETSADVERQPVPRERASNKGCLEMSFAAYLELLGWTGRQWRADKRGAIAENQPPILERLGLAGESWLRLLRGFQGNFGRAAGKPAAMAQEADRRG